MKYTIIIFDTILFLHISLSWWYYYAHEVNFKAKKNHPEERFYIVLCGLKILG